MMPGFHSQSKKIFLLTLISMVAVLLLVTHSLFAQTPPVQLSHGNQEQIGQTGELGIASDFDNDIRLGLQNLTTNLSIQIQQQKLQNEEYKSAWDEFGVNVLVDGAISPTQINKEVVQDIIQTIQTELNYDQQEEAYLATTQTTPEEIQAAEGSTASDVPPGESINPNPSLEENPNVGESSIDSTEQNNSETGSFSPETTSTTSESTNTEIGGINEATSTNSTIEMSTTEASTTEAATTSESTIFEAILQGEQTIPIPESTPTPTETPPTL